MDGATKRNIAYAIKNAKMLLDDAYLSEMKKHIRDMYPDKNDAEINAELRAATDKFNNNRSEGFSRSFYWMIHKYEHSKKVLNAGVELMVRNKTLREQPKEIKDAWMCALLLHDLALSKATFSKEGAYQGVCFNGVIQYPHGQMASLMLKDKNITATHILLPIMLHDQISGVPEEYSQQDCPEMQQYYAMNEDEKKVVCLGCNLVRDADQLANLMDYNHLLDQIEKKRMEQPYVSQCVEDAIYDQHMVANKDCKTFLDFAVRDAAWIYGEHMPEYYDMLYYQDEKGATHNYVTAMMSEAWKRQETYAAGKNWNIRDTSDRARPLQCLVGRHLSWRRQPSELPNNAKIMQSNLLKRILSPSDKGIRGVLLSLAVSGHTML
jgi:hypothetical protein